MQKSILFTLLIFLSLLFVSPVIGKVTLPAIVSSDMVLQRNTTVKLWGWADPKKEITIEASWLRVPFIVETNERGNWELNLNTSKSKKPQTIRIKGNGSDILLENILFGEVWLCSGQSNMQQPLNGYNGQPTFGALEAISRAKNEQLRLFTVDRIGSKTPLKDLKKYTGWHTATPDNVKNFSAVAYFFGQQLQEILNVPVGMIHTSWGGSRVEAWISTEVIREFQDVDLQDVDITKRTNHIPTALFNSMIHPLIPYTIKGALWYQGESNRREPQKYTELFPAMVKDWRTRWDIGDFPFYFVQIAPFLYGNNAAFSTPDNSAFMREAQLQCVDLIPNSGIAITMDIGDDECIHPPKKKEVADRLLYHALNKTYGLKAVDCESPVYESIEIKNDSIILKFKHAETGVFAYDELTGFEIAGEDKVFYPADAQIINRRNVLVRCDQVPNPVAVRYAWRNWVRGTLYDTNLLPASSFRTDTWDKAAKFSK